MDIQQIVEMLSQMEANRKADQAKAEANMEGQIGSLASEMKAYGEETRANRKADKEEIVAEMKADRDAHVQEIVAKRVSAIEEKIEAIVHSIRSKRDGKIQCRSESVTKRQEIPKEGAAVASWECKEQGPKELESGAERQMVLTEEAAVKYSRVTKKQRRGQHIAAGHCVKPTKQTRGGVNPGESWLRLQQGVSLCSSGMAEKKHLQGYPDPKEIASCGRNWAQLE
jgi:hypothetical protein